MRRLALVALVACSKSDPPAPATVDCEKLTTRIAELTLTAKVEADHLPADQAKALADYMTADHPAQVKRCEELQRTEPMSRAQYDCYMTKPELTDAVACLWRLPPKSSTP